MSEKKTPGELGCEYHSTCGSRWYHREINTIVQLEHDTFTGEVWFVSSWRSAGKTHHAPGAYATWYEAYRAVAPAAEKYWNKRNKKQGGKA